MAANRFSSVREEMEKEISSRSDKQSNTTETLDSYMNQRAQSFQEKRKNGAARKSYTAQMDSRRSANDFLTRYNRFLDDVEKSGYTPENVKAFDSIQAEYNGVSGLFNQGARKQFQDSFASIKDYFGSFAGKAASLLSSEQIANRREELQKSYQEALDEAIQANPGVSLHNLPATDDMKYIKEQMDELDSMEDAATYNKYQDMISSLSDKERKALSDSHGRDTTMAYGYLLQNGYSREDINAMYETLMREQNAKTSGEVLDAVYDYAGQNVGTGAVGFTGARAGNIVGGITGTFQAIHDTAQHYFQGSPYRTTDPNGLGYLPGRAASAADQSISDAIEGEDGGFLRQAAAFVYRGAANAADNLARMALASATGGGALAGAGINSALSFTQGFQGSYREAQEKGGNPIQGLLVGAVDGGMEVFTESRTFERWMNLKDPELIGQGVYAWLKSAAVGIGNEITEEEASYIANTIADAVVMADKSESAQFIKDAVEDGKTPAEARWELVKKYAHEMAVTAADTAMSTILMDAGTGAVANYQYKKTYGGSSAELVQEGMESPEGTDSRALAEKYQKKLDEGKQLSGGELRRLVNANEVQFAKEETEAGAEPEVDTATQENVADSEKEKTTEKTRTGFTVGTDSKRGTTVISFEEVPPKDVQDALNENGFKWSKKSKVWYGNATTEQAREIVRAAMEPAVEQENSSPSDVKTVNRAHDVSVEAVAETDKNNLDLQENGEEPGTAEEEHPVTTSLSFGRGSEKKSTVAAEADRPFEISKTVGKTFLNRENGSTVETRIMGIASSDKGKLMLNVAGEDSPVSATDIIYPDSGEESLYYFLNQMQLKPAAANMVVKEADAAVAGMEGSAREEKVAKFAQGIFEMYSLGENGVPLEKALNSNYGQTLTEKMKIFGHGLGKFVYDAKKSEQKGNSGRKETPQNTGKKASAKGAEVNEIQILRNAVDNISSLNLSEKEKNSIGVFAEHLKKLDSVQQQAETIRGKETALTDYERDKLTRLEKQADNIKKKLLDFTQYPLLKSVSAKARELMQQEYGAIKAGENPTRAAELPARTNNSNRVSKTAGTAVEAAVTTDEAATRIRGKAVEGEFSYLPITDKEAQKRAEDTILRKGWNDALSDWRVGMSKTGFPGKDMVTLGFQLYNNAVNAGDNKAAVQILTDITNTVRNSAQTVQAVRILKKLSPENRLYAIHLQLGSLQDELNRKYGDRAPQIDMNSTLAENYRNAKGEENIRAAEEALFRDIAAQLPNTFSDKWNSWRYLSMLGNLRTHVRNVLGNVGFVPVRATKDLIASGMEAAVDKISKSGIDRTKSVLNPLKEADRALYTTGMEDYAAAEELLSSANVKSGDSISRIEQYKPAFGGDKAIWRALSKVAEANSNALSFEDMLFKKTTYASAFAGYLKSNGITEKMLKNGEATESFLDNARAYAFQEALKATYNDVNSFSNFVASFGNLRYSSNSVAKAAGFLVEGVLPFKRTPANIVTRAVEYSPIGMVNGIKKSLVDVRSGKVTAAEAIDALASGLTGTVLLGLGGLLANMGLVSVGDDDDDKQKDFDKLRGKQSYALNAFGGSYTIDWLAPEIIPLFIGVELYNRVQEDGGIGFNDLLESFARVSNPLLEMSCLQSLNDLLDNVSYSDNKLYSIFSQAAANHVLQALPTLFGQIERVGETERETTYIDKDSQIPKDLQYTIAKAANKIPGVEFEQIPYIDAYGRRQENGNLGTRMFTNLLSPGYLSSDRSAPWDDELQRLYSLGYTSVLPSQAPKKIGDYDLNAEEYVEYATFTGQERYRLLSEVTKSKYFIESSDADKAEILADVYGYVNACGSKKILPDREVAKWTEKAAEMEKIGIPFVDFVRMKNEALNENGNATKDGYVSYIRDNFPLDKQKDVWEIMKSPSWKNSGTPWR